MISADPPPPPPFPLSRHPAAAWWGVALALAFIVYETTLPFAFRFTAAQLQVGLARGALDPFAERGRQLVNNADVVGNVLLFIPFGFCLALAPLWPGHRRRRPLLLVLLAVATSAAVEISQLFSLRRYPQTSDVMTNAAGAAVGVALAYAGGRALLDRAVDGALRRLRDDPLTLLVGGLTVAILAGALLPLDLSISHASLLRHLRHVDPGPLAPGGPAGGRLAAWTGLLKMAWLFSFWGAATAHWLAGQTRRPFLIALLGGGALALVAEGLQLFVVSRTLDLFDPLAGLLGVATGATLALGGRRLGLGGRALLGLALAGYGCYLALDMISPLDPPVIRSLLQGELPATRPLLFDPVPLRDTDGLPRMMVLGDWAARLARFAPLGALLRLGLRGALARRTAALGVVAAALGLELIEGRVGLGRGDMTDVVMAGAGLLIGWFFAARLSTRLRSTAATGGEI